MHHGHTDEFSFICAGVTFANDPRGEVVSPTVVNIVVGRPLEHLGVQCRIYVWHLVNDLPRFTNLPACWVIG